MHRPDGHEKHRGQEIELVQVLQAVSEGEQVPGGSSGLKSGCILCIGNSASPAS